MASPAAAIALAGLKGQPITLQGKLQLLAFCVFEVCVGIFWPSMMSMRAAYVPEELRATIINIFRIPLNAFVCIVLGNVSGRRLLLCEGLTISVVLTIVKHLQDTTQRIVCIMLGNVSSGWLRAYVRCSYGMMSTALALFAGVSLHA